MVGTNVPTTMRLLFADVGIEPTEADLADGAAWISRRTEEVFRAGLPWRPGARRRCGPCVPPACRWRW